MRKHSSKIEVEPLIDKTKLAMIICEFMDYRSINKLLLHAAEEKNLPLANLVIEGHADVNTKPERGFDETPLMTAARNGDSQMAALLLANRADIDIETRYGFKALDFVPNGCPELKIFINNRGQGPLPMDIEETEEDIIMASCSCD